jgi:hypothetical protein
MGETVLDLYRSIESRAAEAVAGDLDAFAQLLRRNPPQP